MRRASGLLEGKAVMNLEELNKEVEPQAESEERHDETVFKFRRCC